ncbi:pentatricopeptide repeat-containing protein At2g36730 [Nicotiana tomentosiformis]|uniref:pentatricopeptide repeat-containing protein At2g36730 n=1 Tax=Nicotiana tomentosiformis TaxID=4098 RepID=UPI00051B178C|nr:pentatricopeptide repeat-containing protein At2g36730 [Nicotiana tomentosiformis]
MSSTSKTQRLVAILNSCSSVKHLFQIHTHIIISGLCQQTSIILKIVNFFASHTPINSATYAGLVIKQSHNSSNVWWNILIRNYATCKNCSHSEAIRVFVEMRRCGAASDEFTYPFLFKACSTFLGLKEGKQIHAESIKIGFCNNVYVHNTLVHFYGSCKKIVDAYNVFVVMSLRTVVSWNSIISAFVESCWFYEAFEIFREMRECRFQPDETTMVVLLSACAELGDLSLGKWIHCQVIEQGMFVNCQLGTSLVDMYAKCGAVDYARLIFDRLGERNVWTWSAMILGLAQHGFAVEAMKHFRKMKDCSTKPNYVTFLGVLCACSHVGMVEEGQRLFREMESVHRIKPMMAHYGAMVDILSRAGRLEEAYKFIVDMPVEADAVIWRTLLSSCHIHDINDNTGVGEKVRRRLLALEPKRSGNLVMVANKYAEVGLWEKAANLRRGMRVRRLKKVAGETCVSIF